MILFKFVGYLVIDKSCAVDRSRKGAPDMGELSIHRNRSFAAARYQETGKAEKTGAAAPSRNAAKTAAYTVSETLRNLMSWASHMESGIRESRRTLQSGEAVLAEVQDSLDRAAALAGEAAGDGDLDRAALQTELERLGKEIGRMLSSAASGGTRLFLDGEPGESEGTDALLYTVMAGTSARQDGGQTLPNWLVTGITQNAFTPSELLSALGLTQSAGSAELLAAIVGSSLENSPAAGYLAALYLGAVISGGTPSEAVPPETAAEGLRQLLAQISSGEELDRALADLTGGTFTSLSDFQSRFVDGTAPGLQTFLAGLLLEDGGAAGLPEGGLFLLPLLAGDGDMELMMALLTILPDSADAGLRSETVAAGPTAAALSQGGFPPRTSVMQLGNVLAIGRDLSGLSLDAATGEILVRGGADVTLQGTGQEAPPIILSAGSGALTLQNLQAPLLIADGPQARVLTSEEVVLGAIHLRQNAVLTLGGTGLLRLSALRGGGSLRLEGGAVILTEKDGGEPGAGTLQVPVVIDGPVSLTAQVSNVRSPGGARLEPLDIIWKTLLPGWSSITSMEADGRQVKMAMHSADPARLWLEKWDPSRGYPIHTLVLRGRDPSGRPRTRYAYLRWNRNLGTFEEVNMYPNPFSVTGGEPGRDWDYEESTHVLRIQTNQVTAISGGSGTDANQKPFSGRIILNDGIGPIELALGGVVCRASDHTAFGLGRENDVALLLRSGTDNRFDGGGGCAGISLGEGSSLRIDCPDSRGGSRNPDGVLTASGAGGGAGIGRDSGDSRDRTSRILIQGGVVTATGTGGGAGIGAGKGAFMGSLTITGGTVNAFGGDGGAGIGGALGASVGDIHIRGGRISAAAACLAAAIGAGAQGPCGDILISGTARIVKAQGGNPGADIGACLSGGCGKVHISGGADIGSAGLWTRTGLPLQMGEDTVTLPQFRLSAGTLGLDRLSVATREQARDAAAVLEADRRLVGQVQAAYGALYARLDRSAQGLSSARRYGGGAMGPVRDSGAAGTLLEDTRQSIPLQSSQVLRTHGKRGTDAVRALLR